MGRMPKFVFGMLVLFFVLGGVIFAQEQYGYVRGVVFNPEGIPLAGVKISFEGPYAPSFFTTEERGIFRFINVSQGTYTAKFEATGFKTYLQKNIVIQVGTNVDLLVEMTPGSESEMVISEVIPTLDLKKTSRGATVPQESLEEIPSARDPWVLMQQQTSTLQTSENVGGSGSGMQSGWKARGAVGGSTIYNMDGIVITDGGGGSPSYYDYESFEEVQVMTAGNDASVQTGGTSINFVTKRGTNDLSLSLHAFYTSRHLQGDNKTEELKKLALRGDKIWMIADYGFQLGGPIIQDKIWFWGGGSVQDIRKRTIQGYKNDTILDCANFKLNFQISARDKAEINWVYDEKIVDGRAAATTRPPETTLYQSGPARHFKGEFEHHFSDKFLVSVKGSAFPSWWSLEPKGGMSIQSTYDSLSGFYGGSYQRSWNGVDSFGARTDANIFVEKVLGGDHEFKMGLEWRYLPRRYESGWPGGVQQVYRNNVPFSAKIYREREGKYNNSRYSVYLQDTFTKGRLTLNLGLRFDREKNWIGKSNIRATQFAPAEAILPAIQWDGVDPNLVWNTFSPRFGLTYDLFGDRKTILNVVLARYGLTMNHGLVNHISIVQETYVEYNWNDPNGNRQVELNELVGYPYGYTGVTAGFDPRNPATLVSYNTIDPDVSSPLTDEISIGIQRELFTDFSMSGMFFARRNHNMLWSTYPYIGVTRADFGQPINASTTFGGTTYNYKYWTLNQQAPKGKLLSNREGYYENFWAVELSATKRLSHRWMVNASVTLQNITQNYGDDSIQDPTNIEFLDGAVMEDVQWMGKLSFMYQLPWGINVSGFANIRQGRIFDRVLNVKTPERGAKGLGSSMDIRIEKYGINRYETFVNADMRVAKDFSFGSYGKISFAVDLFNMFNFNWDLNRYNIINSSRYNEIQEILQPRVIRFSLRYSF